MTKDGKVYDYNNNNKSQRAPVVKRFWRVTEFGGTPDNEIFSTSTFIVWI